MTDRESLIDFVASVSGESHLKVEETLGDGFVRLRVSEAERRQAKHDIRSFEDVVVELLRNSRDAHARRIFVANSREGDTRSLTIVDDGIGVPRHLHDAVFQPRVTSKLDTMVIDRWGVHGRGMALFSVRSNVTEARVATSDPHKGCAVVVTSDTTALPERSDQSTWPIVERGADGRLVCAKGPHNIVRRVLEFACEHPEIDIYLGSPAECASTMCEIAREVLESTDLLFCEDAMRLPIWQRLAVCGIATELCDAADTMGLSISERTAHRILALELAPLETVLRQTAVEDEPAETPAPDIYRDRRGLSIHHSDLDEFRRELQTAFDVLSERYYLHLRGEPRVSIGRDEIRVRFDIEKED